MNDGTSHPILQRKLALTRATFVAPGYWTLPDGRSVVIMSETFFNELAMQAIKLGTYRHETDPNGRFADAFTKDALSLDL